LQEEKVTRLTRSYRSGQPDPSQKAQKVRKRRGSPFKVKLPIKRPTQRRVVYPRMMGL